MEACVSLQTEKCNKKMADTYDLLKYENSLNDVKQELEHRKKPAFAKMNSKSDMRKLEVKKSSLTYTIDERKESIAQITREMKLFQQERVVRGEALRAKEIAVYKKTREIKEAHESLVEVSLLFSVI